MTPDADNFTAIPLNTADPDAWDDTALIAAFDNAVATHRTAAPPAPQQHAREENRSTPPRKRRLPAHVKPEPKRHAPAPKTGLVIPPPPPGAGQPGEELAGLLAAWYEAGYRAGAYVARRER